jgi:hypothetical protein
MYGEDIKALRGFQTPWVYLEVVTDHLELRRLGYLGRVIRWINLKFGMNLGYGDTSLDKVVEYLSNNITDWSIVQNQYAPLKRIVKRIRRSHRINPTRFPENANKIIEAFETLTPLPTTRNIHLMTNQEIEDGIEDFTIRELNELPLKRFLGIVFPNGFLEWAEDMNGSPLIEEMYDHTPSTSS